MNYGFWIEKPNFSGLLNAAPLFILTSFFVEMLYSRGLVVAENSWNEFVIAEFGWRNNASNVHMVTWPFPSGVQRRLPLLQSWVLLIEILQILTKVLGILNVPYSLTHFLLKHKERLNSFWVNDMRSWWEFKLVCVHSSVCTPLHIVNKLPTISSVSGTSYSSACTHMFHCSCSLKSSALFTFKLRCYFNR